MAGEEGSFRYTTVYGIDSLGTVTGLDSVNWFVTTISPLEEAFAPIGRMQRQLLFSTLLITMLVGLTMWWLLRSQLKPIFSTIESLGNASGARDLAREVPLTGKQEIDALISSFNQLLDEWYERGEENQRFKTVADNAVYGMAISDMQGRLTYINPFFAQRHGYHPDELIGKEISIFHTAKQLAEVEVSLQEMSEKGAFSPRELWHVDRDGQPFPMLMSGVLLKNAEGQSEYMAVSAIDITERKQAEHEIHQLAYYDLLTSLPNRRLLQDRLKHAMAVSRRTARHGALIFLDIDNFKTLNDTRGHDTGDQLLLETARRIAESARDTDTVARLGGDEFVVILEGLSDDREQAAFDAGQIGEAIRVSLTEPFYFKSVVHHASASLGIALFSGTQQSIETLLKQADLAMYRAKDRGKNTARFFDPDMQVALEERAVLEADLRAALELDQLQLYFQPQVNQHGEICGAEALIRWIHPDRGFVPPDRFIHIAEANGQILSIGRWVLNSACQQLEQWSEQFPEMDLTLAVNVSPEEFRQTDFIDQVRALVQCRDINPSRLRLELTETMLVEQVEATINKMEALQNLGIGFSLDDFGTGYSSLSYLTRLPLDTLKIDKSFVLNLPDNHNDAIIAQTVISMAQSLALDVIAEGVETLEQRNFLVNHDCLSFQGYLFSPPVPQADFERLLKEGQPLLAETPS